MARRSFIGFIPQHLGDQSRGWSSGWCMSLSLTMVLEWTGLLLCRSIIYLFFYYDFVFICYLGVLIFLKLVSHLANLPDSRQYLLLGICPLRFCGSLNLKPVKSGYIKLRFECIEEWALRISNLVAIMLWSVTLITMYLMIFIKTNSFQ